MTVDDVLEKMIGAFRGFDSAAVTAMRDVFQRKLGRHEGAELANAWTEVASSFKPTGMKPYPAPADFEEVLPQSAKMPRGQAPRLDFKGHAERKAALAADWNEWQRPAIAEQFGPRVAFWCEQEVRGRAGTLAWKDEAATVRLGSDDIAKIFESVVSRDRMDTFGVVSHPETWRDQFEQCRAHVVAGRFSRDEIAEPVVAPRGKPRGPTVDLRPEEFTEVPPPWLDDGAPPADPDEMGL